MKDVVMYSTPTCTYCNAAKEFFAENHVPFIVHDVASDTERRQEMVSKSGQMGVPVITVGDELIVGFDEARLRELLGLNNA